MPERVQLDRNPVAFILSGTYLGRSSTLWGMCSIDGIRVQGRHVSQAQWLGIQNLVGEHPDWSRHRIAKELCDWWDWRTPLGQRKTFAARSLLLTLAQRYGLQLPAIREAHRRRPWGIRPAGEKLTVSSDPIKAALAHLQPLQWRLLLPKSSARERAFGYLREHHYLGFNRPVGTHLVYLIQDAQQRDLAVHLVGAAAWQCSARDGYIGWNSQARAAGLHQIGNHSRYLILPWVRVPGLASHLLAGLTRRIASDWQQQHGWRLELLESFVEMGRFAGTAYHAAQWQHVGQTTGRTRQEKLHQATAPRKAVWVYGLAEGFRQRLSTAAQEGSAQ